MAKAIYKAKIIAKRWHAGNIYEIIMENELLAGFTAAGQFLQIDCGEGNFLRRPISVHDVEDSHLSIVFEIKGKGTLYLAERKVGDYLNVLGPLGNGFDLTPQGDALIIGGGIGMFPLYMIAKEKKQQCDVVLGFRTERVVITNDRFLEVCRELVVTTDDGSYGIHGNAVDAARKLIADNQYKVIYACGPKQMLKAVKELAQEFDLPAQISLEERMACGFGVCLSCATTAHAENQEEFTYKHVCKHGPVFDAREVIL